MLAGVLALRGFAKMVIKMPRIGDEIADGAEWGLALDPTKCLLPTLALPSK